MSYYVALSALIIVNTKEKGGAVLEGAASLFLSYVDAERMDAENIKRIIKRITKRIPKRIIKRMLTPL